MLLYIPPKKFGAPRDKAHISKVRGSNSESFRNKGVRCYAHYKAPHNYTHRHSPAFFRWGFRDALEEKISLRWKFSAEQYFIHLPRNIETNSTMPLLRFLPMPSFTTLLMRWTSRSFLASFESKQKICRRSCSSSSTSPASMFQNTLSSTISRSGLGLHTGMLVSLILVLSRHWSCSNLFLFLLSRFGIVRGWHLCLFLGLILSDDFKNHLIQESDPLWSSFQLLLVKVATLSMFLILREEIQKKTMKKLMKGKRKCFLLPYVMLRIQLCVLV